MKKIIFLALAMVIFGGCGKADSAECPDTEYQQVRGVGKELKMRARDDIIINRVNCMYAGLKTLFENIDLKFGEEKVLPLLCKPLEVVFKTNLGQCECKFDYIS